MLLLAVAWVAASGWSAPGACAGLDVKSDEDAARLFATVCGFCHQDGGRRAGKGPQLMGTTRSDEFIINRIATGKPGQMPAFGASLSQEQIEAILHYIRNLKPKEATGS
ncbi:c-type cytochrome [Benzoatithermus flavus]|uniref:Cytochrome c n=1 Tax=Benzoatithermus flavus TaxID=3108223 RepID=A0ABU8XKQ4_9PROT